MNRDLAKKRGLHLLAAAFAIFYVFVSLFPLLFSLLSSFKNNTTIYAAPFALPEALDLENYRYALGGTSLLRGMANSLLYSVLSIALIILMALLVSYAYRVRVPGYRLVFLFFIAGMALPAARYAGRHRRRLRGDECFACGISDQRLYEGDQPGTG